MGMEKEGEKEVEMSDKRGDEEKEGDRDIKGEG